MLLSWILLTTANITAPELILLNKPKSGGSEPAALLGQFEKVLGVKNLGCRIQASTSAGLHDRKTDAIAWSSLRFSSPRPSVVNSKIFSHNTFGAGFSRN